jgi:catechol 2,3-dioxygenase-like lactoylglutathione lyase family enzyme
MRKALLLVFSAGVAYSAWSAGASLGHAAPTALAQGGAAPLPMPSFHHIHVNSADPDRSLSWYGQYWPQGKRSTFGGFPAFAADDFYLLYTKVPRQAPGGFDRKAQRSVPQSAFWTFGSVFAGPDLNGFKDRVAKLDPKQFELVPLFGGVDGKQTALNSAALPQGNALLTGTAIRERAAQEKLKPATVSSSGLDFAYVVDPDGMLVEVIAGRADSFREHTHFWSERPLCTANWHVEHLGAQFPATQNNFSREFTFKERWDPCDVPVARSPIPPTCDRASSGYLRAMRASPTPAGCGTRGSAVTAGAAPVMISRSRSRAARSSTTSGSRIRISMRSSPASRA